MISEKDKRFLEGLVGKHILVTYSGRSTPEDCELIDVGDNFIEVNLKERLNKKTHARCLINLSNVIKIRQNQDNWK